jgi:flagellar biosynthesis protein FlhA
MGYTVVDASTVVATYLSSVIQAHAAELLGREETQALLDHLAKDAPKLVEDVVPKLVPMSVVQKVLQNLLAEGVHIRDMRTILECLAEHAARIQDADELTAAVRVALSRAILQQVYGGARELEVFTLEPQIEQMLVQASATRGAGAGPGRAADAAGEPARAVARAAGPAGGAAGAPGAAQPDGALPAPCGPAVESPVAGRDPGQPQHQGGGAGGRGGSARVTSG